MMQLYIYNRMLRVLLYSECSSNDPADANIFRRNDGSNTHIYNKSHANIMHALKHIGFIVITMIDIQSREQGVQRIGAPQLYLTYTRLEMQGPGVCVI